MLNQIKKYDIIELFTVLNYYYSSTTYKNKGENYEKKIRTAFICIADDCSFFFSYAVLCVLC